MSVYRTSTTDVARKANIVELLTKAAGAGAHLLANGGVVTGPLSISQIRQALGISQTETNRLVCELVDATTIVRLTYNSADANQWRYGIA